ncbi:MAG: DUF4924 family protein [Paludibacteraceae bacterium]|nr:DUF4924 family protein [Paludibacteraceae bacterium]
MLIAKQKRAENIAEYILYMWQVEDIIRACRFDISVIKSGLVDKFSQTEEVKAEMVAWYENLIEMMHVEKIEEKGHLQIVKNIVADANSLHMELLQEPKEIQYNALFFKTLPYLVDFRKKLGAGAEVDDVELSLDALYGILMLRLQKKEITPDTQEAIKQIGQFMAVLSSKYKEAESD